MFESFNTRVAATSLNIYMNLDQHVCNRIHGVLFVDLYNIDRVMV